MLQVQRRVPVGDRNFQMLVSGTAFASSNDVIWSPEHLLSRQRSSISSIHFMLQLHHISHKRQILSALFHLSLLSSLFLLSFSPTSLHPLAFVSTIPINLSTWSPVGLVWFVQTWAIEPLCKRQCKRWYVYGYLKRQPKAISGWTKRKVKGNGFIGFQSTW